MKIEKAQVSGNKATVIFSEVEPHMINAFRRSLTVDVPKMAIDQIEIHLGAISDENGRTYESTTPLFDEIIAHRLGMVPVPTDCDELMKGNLRMKADCDCSDVGCSKCQIMFSLNRRGPCTVYSKDLEPLGDEKLKPTDQNIPIVKLTADEGILIYATAHLGTGKTHARWQAVHAAGYRPIPNITIHQDKVKDPERIAGNCPRDVFEVNKKVLKVKDLDACILCRTCEHEDLGGIGAVTVDAKTDRYIFRFETDGSVDPKTAILYTLDRLTEKFTDFEKDLSELK
ncbi:MAG: DNA-directed RNA polymerase subunit D [Thermoplasmata archaeon]|nr:DNA-directed RNA polymerase subunit D [Thermoplasmata archaeon]